MKRTLILILILLCTASAHAEHQAYDGYWWNERPETFKLGFISGYVTAMLAAQDVTFLLCLSSDKTKKFVEDGNVQNEAQHTRGLREASGACKEDFYVVSYDFNDIRLGTILDGVNEFYKDFRNKGIEIGNAMRYVRDEIKGKPPEELEQRLINLRTASSPK